MLPGSWVWHGAYIDAIQLEYSNGISTQKHGGSGGTLSAFALSLGEFIPILSGTCGDYVDSLTIGTNIQSVHQVARSHAPQTDQPGSALVSSKLVP